MAFLANYPWRLLKSWYKVGAKNKDIGAGWLQFRRTYKSRVTKFIKKQTVVTAKKIKSLVSQTVFQSSFLLVVTFAIILGGHVC